MTSNIQLNAMHNSIVLNLTTLHNTGRVATMSKKHKKVNCNSVIKSKTLEANVVEERVSNDAKLIVEKNNNTMKMNSDSACIARGIISSESLVNGIRDVKGKNDGIKNMLTDCDETEVVSEKPGAGHGLSVNQVAKGEIVPKIKPNGVNAKPKPLSKKSPLLNGFGDLLRRVPAVDESLSDTRNVTGDVETASRIENVRVDVTLPLGTKFKTNELQKTTLDIQRNDERAVETGTENKITIGALCTKSEPLIDGLITKRSTFNNHEDVGKRIDTTSNEKNIEPVPERVSHSDGKKPKTTDEKSKIIKVNNRTPHSCNKDAINSELIQKLCTMTHDKSRKKDEFEKPILSIDQIMSGNKNGMDNIKTPFPERFGLKRKIVDEYEFTDDDMASDENNTNGSINVFKEKYGLVNGCLKNIGKNETIRLRNGDINDHVVSDAKREKVDNLPPIDNRIPIRLEQTVVKNSTTDGAVKIDNPLTGVLQSDKQKTQSLQTFRKKIFSSRNVVNNKGVLDSSTITCRAKIDDVCAGLKKTKSKHFGNNNKASVNGIKIISTDMEDNTSSIEINGVRHKGVVFTKNNNEVGLPNINSQRENEKESARIKTPNITGLSQDVPITKTDIKNINTSPNHLKEKKENLAAQKSVGELMKNANCIKQDGKDEAVDVKSKDISEDENNANEEKKPCTKADNETLDEHERNDETCTEHNLHKQAFSENIAINSSADAKDTPSEKLVIMNEDLDLKENELKKGGKELIETNDSVGKNKVNNYIPMYILI